MQAKAPQQLQAWLFPFCFCIGGMHPPSCQVLLPLPSRSRPPLTGSAGVVQGAAGVRRKGIIFEHSQVPAQRQPTVGQAGDRNARCPARARACMDRCRLASQLAASAVTHDVQATPTSRNGNSIALVFMRACRACCSAGDTCCGRTSLPGRSEARRSESGRSESGHPGGELGRQAAKVGAGACCGAGACACTHP